MDLLLNQFTVKIIFGLICPKNKQTCQLETEGREGGGAEGGAAREEEELAVCWFVYKNKSLMNPRCCSRLRTGQQPQFPG